MVQINVWGIIGMMAIPSAITGFCFWIIEQKLSRRLARNDARAAEQKAEEKKREEAREKMQMYMVDGINAAIALGEATAKAVQRIPDAHCNGDMHAALAYAEDVKHRQRDFLAQQGIKAIQE